MDATGIALFEQKEVRKVWDVLREKRFFSVIDVIEVLTESTNPQVYRRVFKKRLLDEGANETVTKCNELKMLASDGKMRTTDCFSTEDLLRLIQSIPSPKAEPFKLWLAKVGYERVQEIQNPELAQERMKMIYEQK
jgi:prophage antirepressor-like protein